MHSKESANEKQAGAQTASDAKDPGRIDPGKNQKRKAGASEWQVVKRKGEPADLHAGLLDAGECKFVCVCL